MVRPSARNNRKKTSRPHEKPSSASARRPSASPRKAPVDKSRRASSPAPAKSPGRGRSEPHPQPALAPSGLSLDRKLDFLGVGLTLVGLLTLLSLLSTNHSALSGGWVAILRQGFGWGIYLLPLALIALGLWLVLRNFERVPIPSGERVLGLGLLYFNLLALFHFLFFPDSRQTALSLAAQGKGGGYLGALTLEALRVTLGLGGAAVALLAWLLIALTLTLDRSLWDLFQWVPGLLRHLQDAWDEFRARRASGEPSPLADFIPLRRETDIRLEGAPFSSSGTPSAALIEAASTKTWVLPSIDAILEPGGKITYDDTYDQQRARVIEETLASFGAPARVVEVSRGPTITLFGVEPDFVESRGGRMRVRVGKIAALADDLALALSAPTIRIQAPVPGKGYVGIEVPNEEISLVALRDVIESEAFRRLKSPLRFALGQDVAGNAVAADLAAMPHLLIAGATGSGKSVCVNSLITCLLLHNTPDDLRLIMVDPKRVELTAYNGIPHLLAPVVVELERVVGALQWILREMDQRYHKLAQAGCRNLKDYNALLEGRGEKKLPYLVVIIDELADLMMLAPDETERTITRLAQLARATGIHLVIATQRPSVDVVTGLIKANFPARIAFAVASGVDSRVILDQPGAERLLGRGDMLFQAPDAAAPVRLQGTFVSEGEIQRLVQYWQSLAGVVAPAPMAVGGSVDALPAGIPLKQIPLWDGIESESEKDPLLDEAIDLARRQGRASISMLQRRLRIGYTRAARLVEIMEEKGIVGPPDPNTGTRQVLDYGPAAPPAEEQRE